MIFNFVEYLKQFFKKMLLAQKQDDEIQCNKISPNLYQSKLKFKTAISANVIQLAKLYVLPNDMLY